MQTLTATDVEQAYNAIRDKIHKTPILTSTYFNETTSCNVLFKAENFQKTGSFKARGALHAVWKHVNAYGATSPGVVTHSSGNHGLALAYASKCFGVPCTVVVPSNAPKAKIHAIQAYGAKIVTCQPTLKSRPSGMWHTVYREQTCEDVIREFGQQLVHPHSDLNVMAGQGTIAMEFVRDFPQLDAIIVPVSGGGLISGIGTWLRKAKPDCKIIAVEPAGKNTAVDIQTGERAAHNFETIADGLRMESLGELCFPIVCQCCDEVLAVDDNEIIDTMKIIYQRLKVVIEPSAATGAAAILSKKFSVLREKWSFRNVGVLLEGGNVDLDKLPWMPT